jgi:hypothetical protein
MCIYHKPYLLEFRRNQLRIFTPSALRGAEVLAIIHTIHFRKAQATGSREAEHEPIPPVMAI